MEFVSKLQPLGNILWANIFVVLRSGKEETKENYSS